MTTHFNGRGVDVIVVIGRDVKFDTVGGPYKYVAERVPAGGLAEGYTSPWGGRGRGMGGSGCGGARGGQTETLEGQEGGVFICNLYKTVRCVVGQRRERDIPSSPSVRNRGISFGHSTPSLPSPLSLLGLISLLTGADALTIPAPLTLPGALVGADATASSCLLLGSSSSSLSAGERPRLLADAERLIFLSQPGVGPDEEVDDDDDGGWDGDDEDARCCFRSTESVLWLREPPWPCRPRKARMRSSVVVRWSCRDVVKDKARRRRRREGSRGGVNAKIVMTMVGVV